jgi:hypothetical protein
VEKFLKGVPMGREGSRRREEVLIEIPLEY